MSKSHIEAYLDDLTPGPTIDGQTDEVVASIITTLALGTRISRKKEQQLRVTIRARLNRLNWGDFPSDLAETLSALFVTQVDQLRYLVPADLGILRNVGTGKVIDYTGIILRRFGIRLKPAIQDLSPEDFLERPVNTVRMLRTVQFGQKVASATPPISTLADLAQYLDKQGALEGILAPLATNDSPIAALAVAIRSELGQVIRAR